MARRSLLPSSYLCWLIACSGVLGRSCCSAQFCWRPFLDCIFGHSTVVILVCAALIGFTTAITCGNARFAAASEFAGRLGTHFCRHVHHQLHHGNYHSDHQRRAVGRDRQAVDGVCAVVPLCGGADGPRHGGGALSACHRELSGPTIGPWYRCDRKA